MNTYRRNFSTRNTSTPQSQPIPGKANMVKNAAGGYVFQIDDWKRLDRFLILGSEKGTYYVSEKVLTVQNAECALRCIAEDGLRVVRTVVEVSDAGRALKNDPALFVLALAIAEGDEDTRKAAYAALAKVARTASHLFMFLEMSEGLSGWGRGKRKAVGSWYTDKRPADLAYQVVKYRNRNGWSHRDVLRLAHPAPVAGNSEGAAILKWLVSGKEEDAPKWLPIVEGFLKVQAVSDPKEAVELIRQYRLPREAVPTELLNSREVWEALLDDMPMTALIRNLGTMGAKGLLVEGNWDVIKKVTTQLGDVDRIRKARVHPLQVLAALCTYKQGRGGRGSNTWPVVPQVVDALDKAFYTAFQNVEPTGKTHMVCIDVSSSMQGGSVSGVYGMTAAMAAAAMAMVTVRTEEKYMINGFSHQFVPLPITANMSLSEVMRITNDRNFGGTDSAIPVQYALKNNIFVDVFVIYTDNDTWAGQQHTVQALAEYRRKINPNAKLAVVATTATDYSIAEQDDPGMMDFVGFDTSVPQALAEFVKL